MGSATGVGLGLALVAVACASAERREPEQVGPEPSDPVATAAATAGQAFELAAGVVVDPSAPAIYLARPGGGIEALDPASGKPRWTSDEAARPLLAHGGRLLAQGEMGAGLPLAILEAKDGRSQELFVACSPASTITAGRATPAGTSLSGSTVNLSGTSSLPGGW